MILINKKYWQDMKNFVEDISIKFRYFLNQEQFGANYVVEKYTKIPVEIHISADIQKVKYRPITSMGRYIGRSLITLEKQALIRLQKMLLRVLL